MKEERTLLASQILSVFLLRLSALFHGGVSIGLYLLAFLLPVALCTRCKKNADTLALLRPPKREGTLTVLPLLPLTLALTVLVALGASSLFSLFGIVSTPSFETSYGAALLRHALLPAILEELLYRYVPLHLLGRENPRGVVLLSATLFAVAHISVVQLPYAFTAGVCYMALTLLSGSVLPCMLLHFCNNALSVTLTFFPSVALFVWISLALLCVIGAVTIGVRHRRYAEQLRVLIRGRAYEIMTPPTYLYVGFMLLLAALSLS